MPTLLFGLALLALAACGLWDGYRIATTVREPGVFDPVGPDYYMLGVAAVLFVLALCLVVQGVRRPASDNDEPVIPEDEKSNRHLWLVAAVGVYLVLMPTAGYLVATMVFFLATLRIMGPISWQRNALISLALTAVFFMLFAIGADMPLPKGFLPLESIGWAR